MAKKRRKKHAQSRGRDAHAPEGQGVPNLSLPPSSEGKSLNSKEPAPSTAPRRARRRDIRHATWLRVAVVIVLVSLPLLVFWSYRLYTAYPAQTRIAGGQEGGLHQRIAVGLFNRLADDEDLARRGLKQPHLLESRGSLDAYRRLQYGEIDFGLYQAGTAKVLDQIEFDELDRDHRPRSPGKTDGYLTFEEMKWRRSLVETDKVKQEQTEEAFRWLGKDPHDPTARVSKDEFRDASRIRFVANLYSEVVHFVVRADADLQRIGDLRSNNSGKPWVVAVGGEFSGGYAMSLFICEEFGLAERRKTGMPKWAFDIFKLDKQHESAKGYYEAVYDAFESHNLDAAFITMGIEAGAEAGIDAEVDETTVVARLLKKKGKYRLLPIPFGESLRKKYMLVSEYTIPAGTYCSVVPFDDVGCVVPSCDISTIAVKAKLLTREDVDPRLVAAVTRHVLREDFEYENGLDELFSRDRDSRLRFAQEKPEFVIHPGAQSVYNPEEFDLGQFESWEALYSLIASSAIAAFFLGRWFIRRRELKRGHRLDRWIQSLLEIERRQLTLDTGPDVRHEHQLQRILDEVTTLRMRALAQISANELKDDPSGQYFVEMCHALSNKINAKLSRQRIDMRFEELIASVTRAAASGDVSSD